MVYTFHIANFVYKIHKMCTSRQLCINFNITQNENQTIKFPDLIALTSKHSREVWTGYVNHTINSPRKLLLLLSSDKSAKAKESLAGHFNLTQQSGTKPNLVAKIWPTNLVTICARLPKSGLIGSQC